MFNRVCLFIFTLLFSLTSVGESVVFEHQGTPLTGKFLSAKTDAPARAVLILVHGDGAMKHDGDGYYSILAEPLRDRGFAVFSWDKPGVGKSEGHWLSQSMADRQSEVRAAIKFVQHKYGFHKTNTGLLGFSQAGWVLPALSGQSHEIGFVVGIGFARNWIQQGHYLTQVRLQLEGKSPESISSQLQRNVEEIAFLSQSPSYENYVKFVGSDAMSPERYGFVLKNFTSDASVEYANIAVPSLLLWGENDLNVDADHEYAWWQSQPNSFVTTLLIRNASHGMLKADKFDTQAFTLSQWLQLMWLEQEAFAEDFMPALFRWLDKVVEPLPEN